jgi:ketosteroid isomerase-like protein
MDSREVVTKYFEFVNNGQWDSYLGLFDNNIVMDEQLMGHIEGISHLKESIEVLRNAPKFQNHPLEIVVDGDKAMAIWHIEAVGPGGAPIDAKGANFYKIRNGKITYFSNFHDTVPFRAVAGR